MTYQWNIFAALLDPVKGSEQAGKRPVLVVGRERINQLLPVVNVIPLTSVKSPNRHIYPNEVLIPARTGGLAADSIALCYQVRTLDKARFEKHIGELVDPILRKQIQDALKFQLEL
jgi:mRNA interferase MazF